MWSSLICATLSEWYDNPNGYERVILHLEYSIVIHVIMILLILFVLGLFALIYSNYIVPMVMISSQLDIF